MSGRQRLKLFQLYSLGFGEVFSCTADNNVNGRKSMKNDLEICDKFVFHGRH